MKKELVIDIFSQLRDIIEINVGEDDTRRRIMKDLEILQDNLSQSGVVIGSKFGWRDLIRWSGAVAVMMTFVTLPLLQLFIPDLKTPAILEEISWQILSFTFGFAGLATYEKLKIKK